MQVKDLTTASEVTWKFKAVFADLKRFAAENGKTVSGLTEGNITPMHRFTGDTRVPVLARYEMPQVIVDLSCEATEEEKCVWQATKEKQAARRKALLGQAGA